MQLKYLRVTSFVYFMRRFSSRSRRRRMESFRRLTGIRPGMRVLDLGGHPDIWAFVPEPLEISILNLPGQVVTEGLSHHRFTYVEGDACDLVGFRRGDFDLVFSNSVIEHVGPASKQKEFATEVLRLRMSYWIQTPSKWFPIEAHCGMPFWWFYTESMRRALLERWRKKLPAWTEMVASTRVLTRRDMADLFPNATVFCEYAFGIPKSYAAFHIAKHAYPTPSAAGLTSQNMPSS